MQKPFNLVRVEVWVNLLELEDKSVENIVWADGQWFQEFKLEGDGS
jgi:hypothetical protein